MGQHERRWHRKSGRNLTTTPPSNQTSQHAATRTSTEQRGPRSLNPSHARPPASYPTPAPPPNRCQPPPTASPPNLTATRPPDHRTGREAGIERHPEPDAQDGEDALRVIKEELSSDATAAATTAAAAAAAATTPTTTPTNSSAAVSQSINQSSSGRYVWRLWAPLPRTRRAEDTGRPPHV